LIIVAEKFHEEDLALLTVIVLLVVKEYSYENFNNLPSHISCHIDTVNPIFVYTIAMPLYFVINLRIDLHQKKPLALWSGS
jgi:hypothetical protein